MYIDNLKFLLKIILKNWYVAGINNCKKKQQTKCTLIKQVNSNYGQTSCYNELLKPTRKKGLI